MGTAPTGCWGLLWRKHQHHTLDSWCPDTQKFKCGGIWWANHFKFYSRSILVYRRISSRFLKKKRKKKRDWKKERRRKKEQKKQSIERKKNEKKKKREVSEEGSKIEPAGPTRVKGCPECTPSSFGLTHQQKDIPPAGSTQPCSRARL